MTRSMEDFVESRTAALATPVRIDIPVFLPGLGAIGKYGAEPDKPVPSLLIALASFVLYPYRIVARTVKNALAPNQRVYQRAKLRNYEVVVTDTEVMYSPASPFLLKNYDAVEQQPLVSTPLHFESVQIKMSKLTIGNDKWHVHPAYVGDVRWALRKLKEDYPDYDITFSGGEVVETLEPSADEVSESEDDNAFEQE